MVNIQKVSWTPLDAQAASGPVQEQRVFWRVEGDLGEDGEELGGSQTLAPHAKNFVITGAGKMIIMITFEMTCKFIFDVILITCNTIIHDRTEKT